MSKAVNGPPDIGLRITERAGWWEPLACNVLAFSREPPPEGLLCRAGRLTCVKGRGRVCVPKCANRRIAGGTAEEVPSSPLGRGYFYTSNQLSHIDFL